MTPDRLEILREINVGVNALPYSEVSSDPPDWYTDTPVEGRSWVCRMYVQDKATLLKARGFDEGELAELICLVETGDLHAVLGVKDDEGGSELVLDSRQSEIYRVDSVPPGYVWRARQIAGTMNFEDWSGP